LVEIRVCFVCLGNICRSPTAEGILQALVQDAGLEASITVESAGTTAYHEGERPDRRAREVARSHGVELASRARQFRASDFARFDYVIAMDRQNRDDLRVIAPDAQSERKIHLCRAFDPAVGGETDTPDPYGGERRDFEDVFALCHAACEGLLAEIRRQHGLDGPA
jgi:protein-tyrosine phosphatase